MSNPLFFLSSPVFGDSALSAAEPDVRKETQSKEVHIHTDFGGLFALMTKSGYQNPRAGNLSVPCNSLLMIFNLTDPDWLLFPLKTIIIHSLQYFMMFIIPGTCNSILITSFIYNLSLEVVCFSLLCALRAIQKVHQRTPGIKISTQSSRSSWFLPPSMDEVDKSFSVRLGLEGIYKTVALQKSC